MHQPILVLTTGGTIDKQYFDALNEYQIGDSSIARLLEIGRVTHPYIIQEVLRRDSIAMTDRDRELILKRASDSASSRIVITHGTDTMTLTAERLGTLTDKTIVLTGALAPARFSESDAAFNLGMAFSAAQIATAGVYIAINGSIFRAGEVMKDHAQGCFLLKSGRTPSG